RVGGKVLQVRSEQDEIDVPVPATKTETAHTADTGSQVRQGAEAFADLLDHVALMNGVEGGKRVACFQLVPKTLDGKEAILVRDQLYIETSGIDGPHEVAAAHTALSKLDAGNGADLAFSGLHGFVHGGEGCAFGCVDADFEFAFVDIARGVFLANHFVE